MEGIYESQDFNIKSGGFKKPAAIILIKNMMMQASIFNVQQGPSTKLLRGPSGWIAGTIMQVKNFIEVSFVLLPHIPFIIFQHVTYRRRLAAMVECISIVRKNNCYGPAGIDDSNPFLKGFYRIARMLKSVRSKNKVLAGIFDPLEVSTFANEVKTHRLLWMVGKSLTF